MAFKEVSVSQVKEVLRRWLRADEGVRRVAVGAGVDRKTAQRYIDAAEALGASREAGPGQLTDELVAAVVQAVQPGRRPGRGEAWAALEAQHGYVQGLIDKKLTVVKVGDLLARRGIVVPERTLHRYCAERCVVPGAKDTVRLADPAPGRELQTDFGKMGIIFDPVSSRRRVVHALILVAVWSRHMFVWLTFTQRTADVIEGFEQAWEFFGGVFPVVIPDNLTPVITKAEPTNPRINDTFLEYSQERGFLIDAARVRHPKDKARCERQVPYVRSRFFAGEEFIDLADANRRAAVWSASGAGMRTQRSTGCRPAEAFRAVEAPLLLPVTGERYDTPAYSEPKVHPDHHVEVARALYSVPGDLVGKRVKARLGASTVQLSYKGELIKVHARKGPGGRSTDAADLPAERSAYALRDVNALTRMGHAQGAAIGSYLEALLDSPLPWTKMRQAYRLLGLVKKWGPERVEAACARALEAEAVDVNLISRMLERAKEAEVQVTDSTGQLPKNVVAGRFSREPSEFSATGSR